jgi:CheY-like chemotaxis protein
VDHNPESERVNQDGQQRAVLAKTILVAEDTDVVRAIMARALRDEGYTVVEAEDGEAAWSLLADLLYVQMLVIDIVMPRLDGIQLSRRVSESGKHLPVLFVSAYDQNPHLVPGPFLPKPFSPDELVTEVRKVLPNVP